MKKDIMLSHNDKYLLNLICKAHVCKCGKEGVLRYGKHGYFMGCSGYPKCKNNMSIIIHLRKWQGKDGKKYNIMVETADWISMHYIPQFTDNKYKGNVVTKDQYLPEKVLTS
jgi:ssDNA-binding Zn-finger/Zn-ribbon topoisomerase 1